MSSQYENDIAKRVHRETASRTRAYRCGYSGSNAMPQPDVLVTTPAVNYAVELKGPIESERVYVDEDDLEQLRACANDYTVGSLAIKFQRREMMVIRYFDSVSGSVTDAAAYEDLSTAEKFAVLVPDCFEPRVTDSGSLALTKPSTDDWPSATAGSDDVDALLSGLGVVTEDSTAIDL